jgi:O-antigen ligase
VVRIFPRSGFKLIGIGIAFLVLLTPFIFDFLSANANIENAADSASQRLAIWKRALDVVDKDPIFGSGLGVLRTITETVPAGAFEGQLLIPNHPHSMTLQIWAETGGIGASLFALAIVLVAFRMPEPRRLGVSGFLAAALAAQFMSVGILSFDLWNNWLWACGGIVAALIVAMARAEAIEDPSRLPAPPENIPP